MSNKELITALTEDQAAILIAKEEFYNCLVTQERLQAQFKTLEDRKKQIVEYINQTSAKATKQGEPENE